MRRPLLGSSNTFAGMSGLLAFMQLRILICAERNVIDKVVSGLYLDVNLDLWVQFLHFLVAPFAEVHAQPLSPDPRVHPQSQMDGRRRAGKYVVRLVPQQGATPLLLLTESLS